MLGIERAAFNACYLGGYESGTVLEVFRAILLPYFELSVMGGQSLQMLRLLFDRGRVVECGPGEPAVEFIFRRLKKGWRRPKQRLSL